MSDTAAEATAGTSEEPVAGDAKPVKVAATGQPSTLPRRTRSTRANRRRRSHQVEQDAADGASTDGTAGNGYGDPPDRIDDAGDGTDTSDDTGTKDDAADAGPAEQGADEGEGVKVDIAAQANDPARADDDGEANAADDPAGADDTEDGGRTVRAMFGDEDGGASTPSLRKWDLDRDPTQARTTAVAEPEESIGHEQESPPAGFGGDGRQRATAALAEPGVFVRMIDASVNAFRQVVILWIPALLLIAVLVWSVTAFVMG